VENERLLLIGKIVGAHGIKGALKVISYAESASRYATGISLHIKDAEGVKGTAKIKWAKPHAKAILLSLEGITNRDHAEALLGADLFINRELLESPEDGTFYWQDIIGLTVVDVSNNFLGKVTEIIETGSNDVYVVQRIEKGRFKEVLVPALSRVVVDINLETGVMRVELPEGL
jgi:16S rRNA processing protein RimM